MTCRRETWGFSCDCSPEAKSGCVYWREVPEGIKAWLMEQNGKPSQNQPLVQTYEIVEHDGTKFKLDVTYGAVEPAKLEYRQVDNTTVECVHPDGTVISRMTNTDPAMIALLCGSYSEIGYVKPSVWDKLKKRFTK